MSKLSRKFPQDIYNSQVYPKDSATSSLLGAAHHHEDISDLKPHFAILRPFPL